MIQIKTPHEIELMRAAGLVVAPERWTRCAPRSRPGVTTGELDAVAEDHIRSEGAVPVFLGLPRLHRHDLRVGQRRGRARHPVRQARAAPTATSSPSTAARSSRAGTATRRSPSRSARSAPRTRQLLDVTERVAVGRAGRGVSRRPADRHQPRGRAVDPSPHAAPLRDRRPLRRPRHRHRDAPGPARAQLRAARPRTAAGPGPGAGHRADGDARRPGHRGARRRLDRRHHRRVAGPRTGSTPWRSPRTARGCSPPRTAGSPSWPSSA